jgi:hypothetical protein
MECELGTLTFRTDNLAGVGSFFLKKIDNVEW